MSISHLITHLFTFYSLTVILILWHYKQKEKPHSWTTLVQSLACALIGGVMIVIIIANVKNKDAVSFLDNIDKRLKAESELKTKNVQEYKGLNGTGSYYKMEESYYWHQFINTTKNLQDFEVNNFHYV